MNVPELVELDEITDLRRRVLRADDPTALVVVDEDAIPGCFHLGLKNGRNVIGAVSAFPCPSPDVDHRDAWQFRFMAVDEAFQGQGLGRVLIQELLRILQDRGVTLLWANGRDTALGFYDAIGFTRVPGSAHASPSTGLPHHRIVMELPHDG